jgi:anti-sigma regulatory factor (Ser/Thr protein kinase)
MKRMFAREGGSLDAILDEIDRFASEHEFGERDLYFTRLAVEELFTNAVRHASGGTGEILVEIGVEGGLLTIRLTDFETEPFNGNTAVSVDTTLPLSRRDPGGLGIHLVRNIADDLLYEYVGGNLVVTVTKHLEEETDV